MIGFGRAERHSKLITVWFLVRVQAGPPAFAREASEGCRAGAHLGEGGAAASYGSASQPAITSLAKRARLPRQSP
jgi:hypothetical protein